MRVTLDHNHLLGFENANIAMPPNAAKVGDKTFIVGVPTAGHDGLLKTVPARTALTFPAKT